MDTVSMLNKMSFYCQPILPLVYDESMSYYETLCKVVGQLNTTGETVNKLNEGLTGEISDRQAADSELDERLKLVEATNDKIHFLVFDGANPNGGFPTRDELYHWVNEGDAIFTLFRTNEEGRGQIYAASCSYNAGNWGSEASNDFSIIVPIETSYDATRDYAVKQKVAKLTIPPIPQTNLNAPWGLQIIEVNTPYTSAEGVVNLVAVINDSDSVNCSITPSEFLGLYNTTRGGKNLCVAVNAKLSYDGLARSSSVATVDTNNRKIRIAFERDGGVYTENGVKQLNKTLDYIIGDASTNVWTHETIDSKTLDFSRYEGFQFTRGANNVITTDDESTPNAVYTQYHANASGKLYQNLPVRLIDTVDNAEYWNGVFDIKDGNHMTFTFVTSNYATASDKMLVRVIELSANVNTTAWKYAEKEFTIPLSDSDALYVDFWPVGTEETYNEELKAYVVELASNQTFDTIFDSINAGHKTVARLYQNEDKSGFPDSSVDVNISGNKTLGTINFHFLSVDASNIAGFAFVGEVITLIKTSSSTLIFISLGANALPVPNGDGTDNGKVPTVNGTRWEMKKPVVDEALSDTSTNPVQNKVVKAALDKKANNTEATEQAAGLMSAKDKKKLNGIADGANKTIVDEMLSDGSTNPVQNKTVTAALNEKLPKTGGTVTGALRTNDSFSAGGTIAFGEAPIGLSQTADGASEIRYGSAGVDDNPPPLSRLKVARPTADDDAATKKYVDDRNNSPQFKGYVTLTPANETIGLGVGLSPSKDGNNYALDISDVNEGAPTLLTGVKTPTDADTNAAATVEYVKSKVASSGSADAVLYTAQTLTEAQKQQARENIGAEEQFVINGTLTAEFEIMLDKTFAQISEAIGAGKVPAIVIGNSCFQLMEIAESYIMFGVMSGDKRMSSLSTISVHQNAAPSTMTYDLLNVNSNGTISQRSMDSDPTKAMQIATKKYVDDHLGGAPITIKLGTGNAATSTATFAEIKAALEAGKAPILDSAPGTSHWFALNWTLSGTDRLTIQYGTFNVDGGGLANFTFYNVAVSSTGITCASSQFTTE